MSRTELISEERSENLMVLLATGKKLAYIRTGLVSVVIRLKVDGCMRIGLVGLCCGRAIPSPSARRQSDALRRQFGGDEVGELLEAAVERLDVEAGGNLWQHVLESVSHCLEVTSLDTITGNMLVGQVINLLEQNAGITHQVEDVVKTVGDSDKMTAPFTAVWLIDMNSLEEVLSLRVTVENIVEDGSSNGDTTVGEGGAPEFAPEELEFFSVLGRATVISQGNSSQSRNEHHAQHHPDSEFLLYVQK